MIRAYKAPAINNDRVTINIKIATFNEVYLNTFIMLIIIQADRKSETIQFLDVNHHKQTAPIPSIKDKISISLIGMIYILKDVLKRKVCLIHL